MCNSHLLVHHFMKKKIREKLFFVTCHLQIRLINILKDALDTSRIATG